MKKDAVLDPSGCWLPEQGHIEISTLGLEKFHKQAGYGERREERKYLCSSGHSSI